MKIHGYVGSYASAKSKSIISFCFDEEREIFTEREESFSFPDSKYVSLLGNDFVTITKKEKAGIAKIALSTLESEVMYSEDIASCYVTQDDTYIYSANYHEGSVTVYGKQPSLHVHKKIMIKEKAGCHQVLLYRQYMFVPCLLLDKIMVYDRHEFQLLNEIHFPKGSGPRHAIFDTSQNMYVVSELSNQLFLFMFTDDLHMECKKVYPLLDDGVKGAGAAIRLSSDEKFLYISIRDANIIKVFDVQRAAFIQSIDCMGDHPRDFIISDDMRFVFVANRYSNEVAVFKRDLQTGLLTPCTARLQAVEGVCIAIANKEEIKNENK